VGYGVSFYYGYAPDNKYVDMAIDTVYKYPEQAGPKDIVLNCDYKGEKIEVKETLYESTYNYYKNKPNKFNAYYSSNNQTFIKSAKEDSLLDSLTGKIEDIGVLKGLDSDQTLDLAACLMQSIPYDDAKAQKILGDNAASFSVKELVPRYPYETLYDGLGICTDKTYLGIAVFERLGYRTAVLEFDNERHMSIGIGVPNGSGNFDLNLGILELTNSGFKVSDVPELKSGAGITINNYQKLPTISVNGDVNEDKKLELTNPSGVEQISGGKDYQLVGKRLALKQKIDTQKMEIEEKLVEVKNAEKNLNDYESKLATAEANYKNDSSIITYRKYTAVYNEYLVYYNYAKGVIDDYNNSINVYNKLLTDYQAI
jgi:hypothetical protein